MYLIESYMTYKDVEVARRAHHFLIFLIQPSFKVFVSQTYRIHQLWVTRCFIESPQNDAMMHLERPFEFEPLVRQAMPNVS